MNCEETKHHLYNAALGEETGPDFEQHLASCAACREELAALQMTRSLLVRGLPEEEPPRRLAFATDAPARPNPLRFWQWSFAGALALAMLFAALAVRRPVAVPASFTRVEVEQIVNAAVRQSEERQRAETAAVIQAAGKHLGEQLQYFEHTQNVVYRQAEQNRSDVRYLASVLGRNEGGTAR
jgi:anti-sigma factor RsiW